MKSFTHNDVHQNFIFSPNINCDDIVGKVRHATEVELLGPKSYIDEK
jgi:hypothetical protein